MVLALGGLLVFCCVSEARPVASFPLGSALGIGMENVCLLAPMYPGYLIKIRLILILKLSHVLTHGVLFWCAQIFSQSVVITVH